MDKKKEFLFKWGVIGFAILLVSWVIAPFLMQAIGGLMGSVAALGIGAVIYTFLPTAALQLTIWKFKVHKAVVSKAPIQALWERLQEKRENREAIRQKLEIQSTHLAAFRRKSNKMIEDYPEEREQTLAELTKFEQLLALRLDQYKQLFIDVEAFAKFVEKQERRYEMAVASLDVGQVMEMDKKFMDELTEKFAMDEINATVDRSFAQMEMTLVNEQAILESARQEGRQIHSISYDAQGNVLTGNILKANRHQLEAA